jgi:hypothetical protein
MEFVGSEADRGSRRCGFETSSKKFHVGVDSKKGFGLYTAHRRRRRRGTAPNASSELPGQTADFGRDRLCFPWKLVSSDASRLGK